MAIETENPPNPINTSVLPTPTPEQLESTEFAAVWNAIKTWDINVPGAYSGYCGALGNHAVAILDALSPVLRRALEAAFASGREAERADVVAWLPDVALCEAVDREEHVGAADAGGEGASDV